ncbi:dnaJ homolog subfamily C member 30, mitochondrial [Trichomycterus rosablanca]|uniref:dnaJ homolog subfamily C member 30, mitochondrial n=1 Tax=Trichomycterus rosablanca TaxID=2290929 RepID=UPI002F35F573
MAEVRLLFGRGAGSLWPPTRHLPHAAPNKRRLAVGVTRTLCPLTRVSCSHLNIRRCYRSTNGHSAEETPLYKSKSAYYNILEVSQNATQAQIKTAYYKQSFIYHPDKNSGSEQAAFRFSQISEAYDVLGNKALRRKYDLGILSQADVKGSTKPTSAKETPGKASGDPARGHSQSPSAELNSQNVFDFDTFYRAHYGEQLQRQQSIRARLEIKKKEVEAFQDRKLGRMSEIAVSIMLAMAAAILLSLR